MIKKLLEYKALRIFIKENPCFSVHLDVLYCTICNEVKLYRPGEGVTPLKIHLSTKLHLGNEINIRKQTMLDFERKASNDIFNRALLLAFARANIPVFKLENTHLKNFLEEYTGRKILDESAYRKQILDVVYHDHLSKIKNFYMDKDVYLCFDETTDAAGRYILNILIGECSKEARKRPSLFKVIELPKTNSGNINLAILKLLNELYAEDVEKFSNVKMLLSDAAPYAIKVGSMLKQIIPDLKCITCLCHGLHNLCETIRYDCESVNTMISFLKRVLVKNRTNQLKFFEIVGSNIPSFPVITRWGTWIEFAVYIFDNFEIISRFIRSLSEQTGGYFEMIELLKTSEIEEQFRIIYQHKNITKSLQRLEGDSLSTEEQIHVLNDVKQMVFANEKYVERLASILNRNPDIRFFEDFNILTSISAHQIFRFVPLTSVSVERSFSNYKALLSDKRRNLTVENIEKLLSLYYNNEVD